MRVYFKERQISKLHPPAAGGAAGQRLRVLRGAQTGQFIARRAARFGLTLVPTHQPRAVS